MMHWIQDHGADAVLLYFVFSGIVSGMPEPLPTSSLPYRWAYHSLHIIAGDLSAQLGSRIPKP